MLARDRVGTTVSTEPGSHHAVTVSGHSLAQSHAQPAVSEFPSPGDTRPVVDWGTSLLLSIP